VLFKLATGRHLESCGIAIWPCGNNEGARHFAGFLHQHGRNVVFLVDEDSKSNAKHVFSPDKLRSAGLDPDRQCLYLGDPNEIEDLFSDEQWSAAANRSWPRLDAETRTWSPTDFKEHRNGKFSKAVLEMIRTAALTAPTGKPDMLITLALSFGDRADVPQDLREKFELLIKLAR
jgi:putative ATP-dependent endonuclease of OLD family